MIEDMAVVQSMGKATWVRDLASHFPDRFNECDEDLIVFDRYDIPTLSSREISDGVVIEMMTLKQLLSSNVNKKSLAMYFAS